MKDLTFFQSLAIFIFNLFSPAKLSVKAYSDERKGYFPMGFGCWYFEKESAAEIYGNRWGGIMSVNGHEITYGKDGKIGFDLAHSWNNEKHDFKYLIKEAWKMRKEIVRLK